MNRVLSPYFRRFYSASLISAVSVLSPAAWSNEIKPALSQVQALKGVNDKRPMLNSNCPEVVTGEGILVSTMNPVGKDIPENHLNFRFKGDFALFLHHINKQSDADARKTLYVSWVAYNPLSKPVTLKVAELATYVTQPDAPFLDRPSLAEDPLNKLYSGPGDRITADYVHGQASADFSATVQPGQLAIVRQVAVPVADLKFHHNGRSFFARGNIDGALQMATIATFSEVGPPDLNKLSTMLQASLMARPREYERLRPTPNNFKGKFIYGRVAGVQQGIHIDGERKIILVKNKDSSLSLPISSLVKGTFGTKEIQSAKMLRRYDDTAYSAHGNYCVDYKIKFDISNTDYIKRKFYVRLDCPVKLDTNEVMYTDGDKATFFRGAVKLSSSDGERFYHLVLHKGQKLEALDGFNLEPGEKREITLELLYPPDATPPQLLTVYSPSSEAEKADLRPVLDNAK